MKRDCRMLIVLTLVMLLSAIIPLQVSANSAEPPSVTVIVNGAPDDLQISAPGAEDEGFTIQRRAWETCYRLWLMDEPTHEVELLVESSEKTFRCNLPNESYNYYNNVVTLDYETETLTFGQLAWRTPLLVGMRVILTLLIEGAVFWLFGYRSKKSWLIFLIVNLITQGWLNLQITGPDPMGYYMIGYYMMEIPIFIAEMLVFWRLCKEHKGLRGLFYALVANNASMILGGLLLTYLPI